MGKIRWEELMLRFAESGGCVAKRAPTKALRDYNASVAEAMLFSNGIAAVFAFANCVISGELVPALVYFFEPRRAVLLFIRSASIHHLLHRRTALRQHHQEIWSGGRSDGHYGQEGAEHGKLASAAVLQSAHACFLLRPTFMQWRSLDSHHHSVLRAVLGQQAVHGAALPGELCLRIGNDFGDKPTHREGQGKASCGQELDVQPSWCLRICR
eukprot:scaffold143_cov260-Pinguiococcus_pyrenoidosus.AAC.57